MELLLVHCLSAVVAIASHHVAEVAAGSLNLSCPAQNLSMTRIATELKATLTKKETSAAVVAAAAAAAAAGVTPAAFQVEQVP